jgi:Zn finger protein HypA/HybF involved in hydrogenase expression
MKFINFYKFLEAALDGGNHENITVSGILESIVTDTCGYCNHEFTLEDWNANGGNCPWCGCN